MRKFPPHENMICEHLTPCLSLTNRLQIHSQYHHQQIRRRHSPIGHGNFPVRKKEDDLLWNEEKKEGIAGGTTEMESASNTEKEVAGTESGPVIRAYVDQLHIYITCTKSPQAGL